MGIIILILILWFAVDKYGTGGALCFLCSFLLLGMFSHFFVDKKELLKKQQEEKVKKIYGKNTPYLKRSELTDADLESLRYQIENYDEILYTFNSIQELKIVLAALHKCTPAQVEVFNTGEIKVNGLYVNRWRYTPVGQVEYYIPALNSLEPAVEDDPDDLELQDWSSDDFTEYLFQENDTEPENGKYHNNVIRGPW